MKVEAQQAVDINFLNQVKINRGEPQIKISNEEKRRCVIITPEEPYNCLKHVSLIPCFSAIQVLLCSLSYMAMNSQLIKTEDLVLIKPTLLLPGYWMTCCFLRKLYSF